MHVHVHIGVHFAGADQISRAMEISRQSIAAEGVRLGHPGIWQPALRDALSERRRNRLPEDWIETTLGTRNLRRLVLIDPDVLGHPVHLLRDGVFYHGADLQIRRLNELFRDHNLSLSLALRAPKAFVDALHEQYDPDGSRSFGEHIKMEDLSWSPVVRSVREAAPHAPLFVSRYEDHPLIWPFLLRDITDIPVHVPLEGDDMLVKEMLPQGAHERLQRYLTGHNPKTEAQYAQTVKGFFTLYNVAETLDTPAGQLRRRAKERSTGKVSYASDISAIANLPGIQVTRA